MNDNRLIIGAGAVDKVYEVLNEKLNHRGKILYVSDAVVDRLYGSGIKNQIKEFSNYDEEIVVNNTITYSLSIAELILSNNYSCIVGMGGGKVLDTCKYASYVTKTPFLSIPTTAANDGLASPIAVLKEKNGRNKSLGCRMASMILIDTAIISNGPSQLIKAGIGDTISNYCALKDWELACDRKMDNMNGYAYLMSQNSLNAMMKTTYRSICPEFVEVLVNSLVLSGIAMDFAGSSRPVSGAEHLFSHAMDYYYPDKSSLHGIQTALGTVSMLKLIGQEPDEVIDYLSRFDVKINPSELGIDEEMFIFCMKHAKEMRRTRYTYLNEIDLSNRKLKETYRYLNSL